LARQEPDSPLLMKPARPNSSERAPLLWVVLPLAAGIALADWLRWDEGDWVVAVGALAGVLAAAVPSSGRPIWVGLAVMFAGALHYQTHRQPMPAWDDLPDREVELVVTVKRVFGTAAEQAGMSFLGDIHHANDPRNELAGQRIHVQLRGTRDPGAHFARGATLRLVGQISRLEPQTTAGFVQYLEDSGLNFRMRQARWIDTVSPPSLYAQLRDTIKAEAATILSAGLSSRPELAGALRAMLLGERHELTQDAKSLFMRSGTMHLFAISGLHIGVIATALHTVLRIARFRLLTCVIVGTLLLWFYVDLIGLTPSALRAWLMISCYQLAKAVRAPGNPLAAIATSALLVLLLDPLQLFSAGFQMSYAVVLAILIHGLPLGEHWQTLIQPWRDLPPVSLTKLQRGVRGATAGVLSAAAFTWTASLIGLITSVAFFGWFTPLAFYANVILVPLASGVVTGGFLSMMAGLAGLSGIALLFNHAAAILLVVMQAALTAGLGNTGSMTSSFWSPYWGSIAVIAVLGSMVIARDFLDPASRWRWWLPSLVSFLMLVIGLRIA